MKLHRRSCSTIPCDCPEITLDTTLFEIAMLEDDIIRDGRMAPKQRELADHGLAPSDPLPREEKAIGRAYRMRDAE